MKFMKKLLSAVTAAAIGVSMTTTLSAGIPVATAADATAVELVEDMGLGWNLGNSFDSFNVSSWAPDIETGWGNAKTTEAMIREIKKSGFNSVRIPVTWYEKMDSSNKIDASYLARVKEVVEYCTNNGMYAIINVHHDGVSSNWLSAGVSAKDQFETVWKQIAEYFADFDEHLVFESMNEVDISNADIMTLNQAFVDTVRATGSNNADRLLLVPASNNNTSKALAGDFSAPDDDADMIAVSVHYYEPTTFCVCEADASWGPPQETWGTASDYTVLEKDFNNLETKFIDNGIPVIIGEYGVLTADKNKKDKESIYKFLKAVASTAYEKTGMCPVLWDASDAGDMQYFSRKQLSWFDSNVQEIYANIGDPDPKPDKTDRVKFDAEGMVEINDNGNPYINIDLKPYKDYGVNVSSVVINYTISSNKPTYGTGGGVQYNIVDDAGEYHWASQNYTFEVGKTVATVDIPEITEVTDEDGNVTASGKMDMDYLKIEHWYDWTDPSGGTVDFSFVDVTVIFDDFFYVDMPDTSSTGTTATTVPSETTTTSTSATTAPPVGDPIGEAYFIGGIGAASNWSAGEDDGAAITPIYGDGTYEVVWDVTGGGTDTVQFLAAVINPIGDTENFTTDTFENLAVTLDEVWIDGVQLTDYTVGEKSINTQYYEGDGPGVTRLYLHDDWATKIADLPGKTTITQSVKVVFTISGTGIKGSGDVTTASSEATTSETTTTTTTAEETTTTTTTTAEETTTTTATTATSTTVTTIQGNPSAFYGDVNLDGRVDITDAVMLNKIAAGQVKPNEQTSLNADTNADGSLDNNDAVILLRFLVHLIDSLPSNG